MFASRTIDSPIQRPAWRDEYVNGYALRDVEQLKQRTHAAVAGWPGELAKPIIGKFNRAWSQAPKPFCSDAVSMQPLRDAVAFADSVARELATLKLEMVSGDSELCELAERCAKQCQEYPQAAEWIVRRVGLDPPDGRHMTDTGKLLRMQCVRWWRRRMRAHFGQAVESAMRARGYVRKGRAAYCTDWALRRRTSQRLRTQTMLQAAVAENELGEQMSLFDAVQASVSNPVNRRCELMTRIRGFEELATEAGHVAIFGTLTAPSCFHAQHSGGGENELYKAAGRLSVRAAQAWLCRMWARARAKLHRLKIAVYGFRIAEPHHDGTPHWHTLLFLPARQLDQLRAVLGAVWLSEHADEKGAAKYRTQFKKINPALGDAAGYVAKYVAKNIDGFQVGADYEAGGDSATTAHRVDAWASTHRIRQFQQFGGAPVGVWREVRRLRGLCDVGQLQVAVERADDDDWCGFSKASQGIALWKEQTGECNAYREVAQPKVIGVECGTVQARTRLHEWAVNWSGKCTSVLSVSSLVLCSSLPLRSHGGVSVHCSESASEARSLGPVSITVRSFPADRPNDGRLIYQHAGGWHLQSAISVAEAIRPRAGPSKHDFIQHVTYEGALKWAR